MERRATASSASATGLSPTSISRATISGGTIGNFGSDGAGVTDITGGTIQYGSVGNASVTNISGGTFTGFFVRDTATANISGGTVGGTYGDNASVMNITGGTVFFVNSAANSVTNISEGGVGRVSATGAGVTNITGGRTTAVFGYDASETNITGGAVRTVAGFNSSVANVVAGEIGGTDPDVTDSDSVGVYLLSGTLNLYGSEFAVHDIVPGLAFNTAGAYSTLTGVLLDGTALNTTFFLADGVTYEDKGGGTQDNPILPDSNNDGVFTFHGVPSRAWVDPPSVGGYEFSMLSGDFFTSILGFPSGTGDADGLFTVSVGDTVLGRFAVGSIINFADYGFVGGVSAFSLSGISPGVGDDVGAFPIKLGFSSPFASFTMIGVQGVPSTAPEPGTLLLLLPALGLVALRHKRKWGGCWSATRPQQP